MNKQLTETEVRHLARLARLGLTDKEVEMFQHQLAEVIDYNISLLSEVDVTAVLPTSQTTGLKNVWRSDEPQPSLSIEVVLDQAPRSRLDQFVVPAVLGEA